MSDDGADRTDDLAEVVRRERLLLEPGVRASPAVVGELLHPEFGEFGASGRVWDRSAILAALSTDPAVGAEATDFVPVALARDVVLLTYRVAGDAGALRSSVWVRDGSGAWRLRFHQGTRTPPS